MSEEPNKKLNTISFSSLSDFAYCPRFFELMNVKKLVKRQNSVATIFGNVIHNLSQEILENKTNYEAAIVHFTYFWKKFFSLYKLDAQEHKALDLELAGISVLTNIETFFKKTFPDYKVLSTEYKIKNQLLNYPQIFKGYIDIVIKLPNDRLAIIDFKTTTNAEKFQRYQDTIKESQLLLYKKFYSELEKIDINTIDTYFILFPKQAEDMLVIPVLSAQENIDKAEQWLKNILHFVNKDFYPKNLSSCLKYTEKYPCIFYKKQCK